MAKFDSAEFNRRWHAQRDRSWLSLDVTVDNVDGLRASMILHHHYGTPEWETTVLARITKDKAERSQDALLEVLAQLLTLHANRVARAAELDVPAF